MHVRYVDSVLTITTLHLRREGIRQGGELQLCSSHAVPYADNWPRHLVSLHIHQMQQVSRMIGPARIIAQQLFVHHTALALLRYVGDPYTPDPNLASLCAGENVLPQRFVELFREATRVRADDGNIAFLGFEVGQRNVLLDGHVQDIFLRVGCRAGVVSDVLAGDGVFDDLEQVRSGHVDVM